VRDFCLLKVGVTVFCVRCVGDIADGVNGGGVNRACSTEFGENGVVVKRVAPDAVGVVGLCASTVGVTGVIAVAVAVVGDGANTIGVTGVCIIGLCSTGIGHGS
jgi:hypothetical protein